MKLSQIHKLEDIQFSKDLEVKSKTIYQIDYKVKELDTNNIVIKTDNNKLIKIKNQK